MISICNSREEEEDFFLGDVTSQDSKADHCLACPFIRGTFTRAALPPPPSSARATLLYPSTPHPHVNPIGIKLYFHLVTIVYQLKKPAAGAPTRFYWSERI